MLTLPVGSTDIDVLTATRAWLDEQITTALEGGKGSTCAECVIQVRLPNSRVVRGSFYPGETLQAVRTFVEHSSLMIRGSVGHSDDDGGCGGGGGWVLQQTAPVKTFTEQETSQTLDSLGLTPRAVLVARILEGGAGRSGGAGAGTAGVFGGGTGGGADSAMDEARAEHQQKMQQRQAALRLQVLCALCPSRRRFQTTDRAPPPHPVLRSRVFVCACVSQKQQLAAEREAERTQALREFESDREEQRERRKMRMGGVGGDSRAVDGDQQGGGQGNGDASGGADDGGEQEGLVESEGR